MPKSFLEGTLYETDREKAIEALQLFAGNLLVSRVTSACEQLT